MRKTIIFLLHFFLNKEMKHFLNAVLGGSSIFD